MALAVLSALLVGSPAGARASTLVSRASGSTGAPADRESFAPTATADGAVAYFDSYATNLTDPATRHGLRLFRRDLRSGSTSLVPTVGRSPEEPMVSANGRTLAYVSGYEERSQIYVLDLRSGSTRLVSRGDGLRTAPANGSSASSWPARPTLSANGRFLAFSSAATNLLRHSISNQLRRTPKEIYVRDLSTESNQLVSRASGPRGKPADGNCSEPEISANGRFVAFACKAGDLPSSGPRLFEAAGAVYVRDLRTGKTIAVSRSKAPSNAYAPAISADGRYVAYFRDSRGNVKEVYVTDLKTHRTELVSRASGPDGAPADFFVSSPNRPAISADGNLVAFFSAASNLGAPPPPGGSGGNFGVFLRDRNDDRTTFVAWEGNQDKLQLAGNGRYVFFGSEGTPGPGGSSPEVYRYDRGPGL